MTKKHEKFPRGQRVKHSNKHVPVSCKARGLKLGLSHYLNPLFVSVKSKGTSKTVHAGLSLDYLHMC